MDDHLKEIWRKAQREALQKSNIRDITEGPIVGKLAYVFRQLEENGFGRDSKR